MPTYLVSGFFRSGTSALMQALHAGGTDCAGEHDPEGLNAKYGRPGYRPNPRGFWQWAGDFASPDFPRLMEGRAVKLHWDEMDRLAPGEYRVAFLLRDPGEIRHSLGAFFGAELAELPGVLPALDDYHATVGGILCRLALRPGVRVTPLRHADLMHGPRAVLTRLAAEGWPVDQDAGARAIDRSLYRSRATP